MRRGSVTEGYLEAHHEGKKKTAFTGAALEPRQRARQKAGGTSMEPEIVWSQSGWVPRLIHILTMGLDILLFLLKTQYVPVLTGHDFESFLACRCS